VATRAARLGVHCHAGLEAADSNDLILGPNSDSEGAGATAQNNIEAVVERLERWDHAAMTTQTREAERSLTGSSLGSWTLELCLGKEEAGTSKIFEKLSIIESTEISSFCKNLLGNTIGAPKNASAGERPVSSLGYALSPRSTKGNSSDHVTAAARTGSASLRQHWSLSTALFDSG
jgi:hypothetical protein